MPSCLTVCTTLQLSLQFITRKHLTEGDFHNCGNSFWKELQTRIVCCASCKNHAISANWTNHAAFTRLRPGILLCCRELGQTISARKFFFRGPGSSLKRSKTARWRAVVVRQCLLLRNFLEVDHLFQTGSGSLTSEISPGRKQINAIAAERPPSRNCAVSFMRRN